MKEPQRYSSLKMAMQRQDSKSKLSTNFTFATMQRLREAAAARERRENRIMFLIAVAASLLMIAVGACIIAPMIENYTFSLPEFARTVSIDGEELGIYLPFFAAFMLLLLLDIKLRAIQRKKFNE